MSRARSGSPSHEARAASIDLARKLTIVAFIGALIAVAFANT